MAISARSIELAPRSARRSAATNGCASRPGTISRVCRAIISSKSILFMTSPLNFRRNRLGRPEAAVVDDLSVEQRYLPLGLLGPMRVVRDHYDGAPLLVQSAEEVHHQLCVL